MLWHDMTQSLIKALAPREETTQHAKLICMLSLESQPDPQDEPKHHSKMKCCCITCCDAIMKHGTAATTFPNCGCPKMVQQQHIRTFVLDRATRGPVVPTGAIYNLEVAINTQATSS